jgi:hypothetical protein
VPSRSKKETHPKSPSYSHEDFLQSESFTRLHMPSVYTSEPLWVKNPDMTVNNVFGPEYIMSFVREVLRMKTSDPKPSRGLNHES